MTQRGDRIGRTPKLAEPRPGARRGSTTLLAVVALIFGLALVSATSPGIGAQGAGVGISPSMIAFGEVGLDSTAVRTITIDSERADPVAFDIAVSGDESNWFTVHTNETGAIVGEDRVVTVVVEPGSRLDLTVAVTIPQTTLTGQRLAAIQFIERTDANAVGVAFEIPVSVTIGETRRAEGHVLSVEAVDVEAESGFGIELMVRIMNTGNTLLLPEGQVRFINNGNEIRLTTVEGGTVSPGRERILTYVVTTVVPRGDYTIEAGFTADGVDLGEATTSYTVDRLAFAEDDEGADNTDGRSLPLKWIGLFLALALALIALGGFTAWRQQTRPVALHASPGSPRRGRSSPGRHAAGTASRRLKNAPRRSRP